MEMKKEKFLTGKRWRKPSNILAVQVSSAKTLKTPGQKNQKVKGSTIKMRKMSKKLCFFTYFVFLV